MDAQEAIKLIDAISESLRNDPSQFHYDVHVEQTGLKVQQTGPGIGYISSVTGGGTGTQITVSATTGDVKLVRSKVDEAVIQDVKSALNLLEELKEKLSEEKPNKSSLEKIIEGLKKTVLSPALVAAITTAINMAITGQITT